MLALKVIDFDQEMSLVEIERLVSEWGEQNSGCTIAEIKVEANKGDGFFIFIFYYKLRIAGLKTNAQSF